MIEGLLVTPLKSIANDKGNVLHAMKASEDSFFSFGEAYFSFINHYEVKGWKKHLRMYLNLIVPIGAIKFVAYDDRKCSKTYKHFFEITLSEENYCRLSVPPGVWLSFQGINQGQNLLLNIASIEHDPTESMSCNLSDIQYNWKL